MRSFSLDSEITENVKAIVNSADSILLINEKMCEFLDQIREAGGIEAVKKCRVVPSSLIARKIIEKYLKLSGLKDYINKIIIDLKDKDGDFFLFDEFPNLDENWILDNYNMGKKFDICFMNPPYAHGLHEKFLLKALKLSNEIVSIEPDSFLFKNDNKGNVEIKNLIKDKEVEIISVNGNKIFKNVIFPNTLCIIYVNMLADKRSITMNEKVFNDIFEIKNYSFYKGISEYKEFVKHIYEKDNAKNYIKNSLYEDKYKDYWCVQGTLIRGHIFNFKTKSGKDDDFYTWVSNNELFINSNLIRKYKEAAVPDIDGRPKMHNYFLFKTEREAKNFVNYLKTDFARSFMLFYKKNQHLNYKYLPWLDFSEDIFSKSVRELDDILFKRYKINNNFRKAIESMLPDYYRIRK